MKYLKMILILSLLFVVACEKDDKTSDNIIWHPATVDKPVNVQGDLSKFTEKATSFLTPKLFSALGAGYNELAMQIIVDANGKFVSVQFIGNDKVRKINDIAASSGLLEYLSKTEFIPAEANSKKVTSYIQINLSFNYDETGKLSMGEKQLGEEPYTFVEQMPNYKGGNEKLLNVIRSNIKYPEIAKRAGIEGKVMIQFVVNKNGEVVNPTVLKGIGAGCDEEALRVVKMLNDWEPGKQNGKIVNVKMVIPIHFKLQ